jgi:hypothetical protein
MPVFRCFRIHSESGLRIDDPLAVKMGPQQFLILSSVRPADAMNRDE